VLRDQPQVFGRVASDATVWRALDGIDEAGLARLRSAVRQTAWAQLAETRGGLPASRAAGLVVPGIVLDLDASIVVCHSDKQNASATWKHTLRLSMRHEALRHIPSSVGRNLEGRSWVR